MISKRLFCLLLVFCLLLCGCDMLSPTQGTLELKANDISSIQIKNPAFDRTISAQDRESISTAVKLLNSLTLENGEEALISGEYELILLFTDGTSQSFLLSGRDTIATGGYQYYVDTGKLVTFVEKAECSTLTDEELLTRIFQDDYLTGLSITNEQGELSLDKITKIPDQCPALFELLGRTSFLESMGSYGLDKLKEMAESADETVREQAEKLGEIFSTLIPSLKEEIRNIIG